MLAEGRTKSRAAAYRHRSCRVLKLQHRQMSHTVLF